MILQPLEHDAIGWLGKGRFAGLSFVDPSGRLTPEQQAYAQRRASVDFVVYNRVTDQPLLAIEVDGFAFHENRPDQRVRDALKDQILGAHQMPLLRLPTTGSREYQRIRQALDNAEAHWAPPVDPVTLGTSTYK